MDRSRGDLPPDQCVIDGDLDAGDGWTAHTAHGPSGQGVCVLRGTTPEGVRGVEGLADLLEDLRARGAEALPRVLGRSRDGCTLEEAEPFSVTPGRRSAEGGDPCTKERLARAAARDELDRAVSLLHERSLALGLPPGSGLGLRSDGRVMIRDVRHLVAEADLAARLADQRWIDSVILDPGRTLRRRIDTIGREPAEPTHARAMRVGGAGGEVRRAPGRGRPGPGPARSVTSVLPERSTPAERRRGLLPVRRTVAPARAWPGRGRRGVLLLIGGAALTATVALAALDGVQLRAPSHPGVPVTAAPSADASSGEGTEPGGGEGSAPAASSGAPSTLAVPAPPGDPLVLARDLAARRRDHILGISEASPTVPGSPAETRDAELRAAYGSATVRGWSTDVLRAEITALDTGAGTARLRVVVTEREHEVVTARGAVQRVPASAERTVELDLQWVDGSWRIRDEIPV